MQNKEMFAGLKVVELASVLAGPSVGQFFAELGAEVLKVENLRAGGDVTRTWLGKGEIPGKISAYFSAVNWGKQSIAIDLSATEGKEIVWRLCAEADLVIASYKPGDAIKLGVDYPTLKENNEKLVYGEVTGYGPDNERVGYDAVIQAESGFMSINGEKGGNPLKMPVALIDVLAAHHLKEGLLLALLSRQQTGLGQHVAVSLIQSGIASLANQATNWLVANNLPGRQGSEHPNIAPYGDNFMTVDAKRVLLAIGSDRQFEQLCKVLSISDLSSDIRFSTNPNRVKNREALNQKLAATISTITATALMQKCNALKIPAGIIQNIKEVFEMDAAKQILLKSDDLHGVRNAISTNNGWLPELSHILPPPKFGQHTDLILTEKLSFDSKKVKELRSRGIIR